MVPTPANFADYPEPKEGPNVKYHAKIEKNPVFRGLPLVIGANVCVSRGSVLSLKIGTSSWGLVTNQSLASRGSDSFSSTFGTMLALEQLGISQLWMMSRIDFTYV